MIDISVSHLNIAQEAALLIRDGGIVYANPRAVKLFGEDCVGKRTEQLLGEEFPRLDTASYVGELELPEGQLLAHTWTENGTTSVLLTELAPPPEIVNDVLLHGLRDRLKQIEYALSPLRTHAEDSGDELSLKCLAEITESSLAIRRGVENLTVAHQIQAGRLNCRFERFDVCLMLHELADTVNLLLRDRVKLTVRAAQPEMILADYEKIEQLLLNLISNALHAEGVKNITLNVTSSGAKTILSVDDDGAGIPEEEMAQTFSRFQYRCELRDAEKGAGLGLTVVRGIAQAHGGTLLMESEAGRGTRVRVSLCRRTEGKLPNRAARLSAEKEMNRVLAGLSGCLDKSCYREQFFD